MLRRLLKRSALINKHPHMLQIQHVVLLLSYAHEEYFSDLQHSSTDC